MDLWGLITAIIFVSLLPDEVHGNSSVFGRRQFILPTINISPPSFNNLFAWLNPKSKIHYLLWTRDNTEVPIELYTGDARVLRSSRFNSTNPTKIIIHGFADNGRTEPWLLELKDELLTYGPCNLISVDWTALAMVPLYHTAAANTELVANELSFFLDFLSAQRAVTLPDLHVIGFSLGSHVAGIAGKRVRSGKLGRITALDPAHPAFRFLDNQFKLHKSDALFVDVIHTTASKNLIKGVGMLEPLGHVDFYPNGGTIPQPGCESPTLSLSDHIQTIICSHRRAIHLITDSVNSQVPILGCHCQDLNLVLAKSCRCGRSNDLVPLGVHTPTSARGQVYLITNAVPPFGSSAS